MSLALESPARARRGPRGRTRHRGQRIGRARPPGAVHRAGRHALGRGHPHDGDSARGDEPDRRSRRRRGSRQRRTGRRAGAGACSSRSTWWRSTAALLAGPPILAMIHVDPVAAASLRASAAQAAGAAIEGAKSLPTVAQWIVDLVPANPVKAASDGAMLPAHRVFARRSAWRSRAWRPSAARCSCAWWKACRTRRSCSCMRSSSLAPLGVFALAVSVASKTRARRRGRARHVHRARQRRHGRVHCVLVLYPAAAMFGGCLR